MAALIVTSILALGAVALSMMFWFRVSRGEDRFRERMARRYDVAIGRTLRGHWDVVAPGRPALSRLGIELLQMAYFMGAFVVWGLGLVVAVLVLTLVQRAF